MGEVVAVLVVPAEGDPGGLLARGRCGSRPAAAHACGFTPRWLAGHGGGGLDNPDRCPMCTHPRPDLALPLWWDGALVPEGWDRARRVHRANGWQTSIRADPTWTQALSLARDLVSSIGGRVVRLARVDGRLVEVTG